MSGDKLNTAEHDSKGRCVRHPVIRLRKKKLLGGWKIIIGHCPECCLDEMRRVRDEIEGKETEMMAEKKKKSHKKSSKDRSGRKSKSSSSRHSNQDDASGVESEGYYQRGGDADGGRRSGHYQNHRHKGDGESEATGSTSQMTDSISGAGSVVSEQYVPTNRGFPGSPGSGYFPPPVPMQQPERTMVLSMNFVDPQTGQRGTYTGQVNSMSHKPDGKGTVYYSNGSIAEGTWSNGVLAQDESSQERHPNYAEENQHRAAGGRPAPPSHHYSQRETSAEPSSRSSRSRSVSHHQSGQRRSRSRGPAAQSVDPPIARNPPPNAHPSPSMMMGGNLDRLESLGGNRRRTRGASASVQSFNSRTSRTSQFGSQSVAGGHYNTSSSVAPMHPSSFHGDPPLQGQNYQNPVSSYYNNLRPSPPMGNSRRGQFEG